MQYVAYIPIGLLVGCLALSVYQRTVRTDRIRDRINRIHWNG